MDDLIPKLVSGVRNEHPEELIVGSLGWSTPCCIYFENKLSNLMGRGKILIFILAYKCYF